MTFAELAKNTWDVFAVLCIIIAEAIVSLISALDLYITSIGGCDLLADSPSLTHPLVPRHCSKFAMVRDISHLGYLAVFEGQDCIQMHY